MTLEIGYHVMSQEAAAKHGVYDDELSIVEFLRHVDQQEELPLDVTVTGLDDYLAAADDPEDAAEHVHELLRDRVNFIMNQSPVIQFVVDDVETWNGGVLSAEGTDIRLITIFGGSIDQEGAGWYAGEFNVQT
jgi:hypothetical protein